MFYEAVAEDGARSIGAAVSRDGLRGWARLPAPVLAAGAPGAWDAGGVGAPCAVPMAGARPARAMACAPTGGTCIAVDRAVLRRNRALAALGTALGRLPKVRIWSVVALSADPGRVPARRRALAALLLRAACGALRGAGAARGPVAGRGRRAHRQRVQRGAGGRASGLLQAAQRLGARQGTAGARGRPWAGSQAADHGRPSARTAHGGAA